MEKDITFRGAISHPQLAFTHTTVIENNEINLQSTRKTPKAINLEMYIQRNILQKHRITPLCSACKITYYVQVISCTVVGAHNEGLWLLRTTEIDGSYAHTKKQQATAFTVTTRGKINLKINFRGISELYK